jgi:anaerobic selenocysteine-containing dehydrogenase
MHAAACIPTITGAWLHEGGGAFHKNNDVYKLDKTLIEGLDVRRPGVRQLDMTRIGRVLTGDPYDLRGGPPIEALFIQNMNPAQVAPEQRLVKRGLMRDDLFVCVHEQFMTATAELADIVLPATMFLEHDDVYTSGGHQHLQAGPKHLEPPGECRSNHDVISALARRVGARHRGFEMSPSEILDETMRKSGYCGWQEFVERRWLDLQPDFETSHFVKGFGHADGKFHFKPDWAGVTVPNDGPMGPMAEMPRLPDFWAVNEPTDRDYPFRLATSPARSYLNSSFNEMPSSRAKEGPPRVRIHPDDLMRLGLVDNQRVRVASRRGEIVIRTMAFSGVQPGCVIIESIPPNSEFENGEGLNTLTSADQPAPFGGGAFHDNAVSIRAA